MKKLFTFLFFFLIFINSFAQVNQKWVARFDENGFVDEGSIIRSDNKGSVYVFGNSSTSGTVTDFLTIKYDTLGNLIWRRLYNGSANNGEIAASMELDNDGNIYVTGRSDGVGTYSDYCVIKYRPNGDSVWVRRFNGLGNYHDVPTSMKIDNNKNVYITGLSFGYFNPVDFLTIKYDSNGILKWYKMYNGLGNDYDAPQTLILDDSNNVYVSGISTGAGTNYDFCTIKYNNDGIQQWVARYNSYANNVDQLSSMTIDKLGNFIVTGYSFDSLVHKNFCTIKYNSSGTQIWIRTFSRFNSGNASFIQTDSLNNIFVTGYSQNSFNTTGITTIKYSPNGDSLWVKNYDATDNASVHPGSMIIDKNADIYITGSIGEDNYPGDCITIKYNTNGDLQWVTTYNNNSANKNDNTYSICLDANKNVYVTGSSQNNNNNPDWSWDCLTIKYSQSKPSIKVNMKILIEGIYYNLLNKMLRRDTCQVYLRDAVIPYSLRDSAKTVIDSNTFSGLLTFSNAPSGNYYLTVKHFSSIETWSKSGGELLSSGFSTSSYDFTNSINKAFGNNLKLKGTKYCLFSGDINQDGYSTLYDLIPIYNDASNFIVGNYLNTDLNGDRIVDIADLTICYNNSVTFVSIIRP